MPSSIKILISSARDFSKRHLPRPAISFLTVALAFMAVGTAFATKPTTATPVISLASGTYTSAQTVTITDSTPGAVIYYALNGPVTNNSPVYSGPITVSDNTTIQAEAQASGDNLSQKASAAYTFPAAPPVITPAPGTYYTAQTVSLSTATAGALIYYTTDGSTPTTSSYYYNGPFTLSSSAKVQAVTISKNFNTSTVSSTSYTIEVPAAAPTFSLAPGTYSKAKTVSLSSSTKSAVIYYTTDGSTPTVQSSVYSGPLTVSSTETISAMALAPGGSDSPVSSAAYVIQIAAATPTFSPTGGKFTSIQHVTIADATHDAVIYYTTDGSTPTSSSAVYSGPITVSASETIQAVALASGGVYGPVSKAIYQITLPTANPVISPPSGTYGSIQSVTITDATPGAVIHYTVNGSYPNTNSPVYSGPITAPTGTTIQAMAAVPNNSNSSVVTAQYTVVAAAPSITPTSGTFDYKATVTMATTVPGGVIHYTSDGSTPTASSAVYTGPISLAPNKTTSWTYQALVVAPGFNASSVSSGSLTITMPAGILANATVSTTPQKAIPQDFMGLSEDFTQPTGLMGQASTGVNTIYRTLVKNFAQNFTAPLFFRIEGDNSTPAQLQPDIEPLVEFAQAVNVRYTLGVDLMNGNPATAAQEATQWMNGIPNDLIYAFEIGNEPDNYPYQGVRPSTYAFPQYLAEYQQWQQAVEAATGGKIGTMAAATAGSAWRANAEAALSGQNFTPVIVSQHSYCGAVTPGATFPADYLLEPINVTKMPQGYAPYAAAAHQQGLLFRMGEINSVGGGGAVGISNTFQSALWAIDVMFNYLNAGADGVNWHSGQYTPYALYEFKPQPKNGMTVFNLVSVNPDYYGLLAFSQLAGHDAKLLPVSNMTDSNVSIWATVDSSSTAHVVVINKDEQATGDVQITLPGYTTGTVRYLKAPSMSSTNGVTLGGQTFDGTPDGTIQGTLVTSTITAENGVFTLHDMPVVTAALIDFSSDAPKAEPPTPASISVPAPGSTLSGAVVTFQWPGGNAVSDYELLVGTTGAASANVYSSGPTTATSATVTVPTTGATLYVTLKQLISGKWQSSSYTYTEAGSPIPATITSPAPGSTLSSGSVTFNWAGSNVAVDYQILIGTTGAGSYNVYTSSVSTATSATVSVPTTGATLYVLLRQLINGSWQSTNYTYTESGAPIPATITSPAPGSTLGGDHVTFEWPGSNVAVDYQLLVGIRGINSSDVYNSGVTTATSATIGVPTSGEPLYVTLRQLINGAWQSTNYTYTQSGSPIPAVITSPTAGETLSSGSATFQWGGSNIDTDYQLMVGTKGPNSSDVFSSGVTGATSATVTVPSVNGTLYVLLKQLINGKWQSTFYTYSVSTQ